LFQLTGPHDMDVRIERGVPIPKANCGERGSIQRVLLKMRKGDSVHFPGRDTRNIWEAGRRAFGQGNFTVRKENGGARIWRL
jgi:hypothetical protein